MALKLKLKVGGSSSSTPKPLDDASSKKAPKIKLNPPKQKIAKPDKIKKLKINFGPNKSHQLDNVGVEGITQQVKRVPKVRIKPTRVPGEGYDSETPDIEDDPLIENGLIIRFLNDINLDLVHSAVDSNDLSGINIKWLTKEKALVNIKGNIYSARLVDLPTVSEVFKTIDKKNIFKVLDLCQMLLVLKPVLPNDLNLNADFEVPEESTYRHALYKTSPAGDIKESRPVLRDGLISPLENVYRRFRPRKMNHRVMDDIEAKVDEMIRLDNEAEESHFEILDKNAANLSTSARFSPSPPPQSTSVQYQTDVIEDDFNVDGDDNIDLEEELAKALETNVGLIDDEDDNVIVEGETPMADDDDEQEIEEEEEEDDEDDEDDNDEDENDDDDDDEDDDGHKSGHQHAQMLEEEIQDLEKAVEVHRRGLENATHKMMKMKFQNSYNTLKASLDSKRRELTKLMEDDAPKEDEGSKPDEDEDEDEEDEDKKDGSDDDANLDDLDDLF